MKHSTPPMLTEMTYLDYEEFTNLSTDPYDADSDGDGLDDGVEVMVTMTNPLVADLDNDNDGYRWFNDCDDNNSNIAPDKPERWNGLDDDCDEIIDEGVNRLNHLMQNPSNQSIVLNASSDELYLSIDLNLTEEQMAHLNLSITWWRNGQIISTNMTFFETTHDCVIGNQTLTIELCKKSGLSEPYEIILFLDDGRESISVNWSIVYNVQLPEENEGFSIQSPIHH